MNFENENRLIYSVSEKKGKHIVKRNSLFKKVILVLAAILLLFSLTACAGELPEDAEDPSDALMNFVKDFWDSEIYENAIYDAIYNSETASAELQSFNRLNSINAKNKIMSKSSYQAETVSIDGTTAIVKLKIHGINFGTYAETFLEQFDALQAKIAVIGDQVIGMTAAEATLALQMMPYTIVDYDSVTFRDFEQEFKLKYENGEWVIKSPKYDDGKVFLELFAEHMTDILKGNYKFRPGLGEE